MRISLHEYGLSCHVFDIAQTCFVTPCAPHAHSREHQAQVKTGLGGAVVYCRKDPLLRDPYISTWSTHYGRSLCRPSTLLSIVYLLNGFGVAIANVWSQSASDSRIHGRNDCFCVVMVACSLRLELNLALVFSRVISRMNLKTKIAECTLIL